MRDGGTLRWAVDAAPGTLNAFQSGANDATSLVAAAVLPAAFRLDGQGRPYLDTDLLRSAKVVRSEPQQVVSYRLNPKAVWSDGRPIAAADFAAQWKALRGTEDAYWTARNAGYDRISSVTAGKDAHEVKVTFEKRYADWQSLFTPLYPKAVTGTAKAFNEGARRELPVAGGPFAVRSASGSPSRWSATPSGGATAPSCPSWSSPPRPPTRGPPTWPPARWTWPRSTAT